MRHAEQDDTARQWGALRRKALLPQGIQRTPVHLRTHCLAFGLGPLPVRRGGGDGPDVVSLFLRTASSWLKPS